MSISLVSFGKLEFLLLNLFKAVSFKWKISGNVDYGIN